MTAGYVTTQPSRTIGAQGDQAPLTKDEIEAQVGRQIEDAVNFVREFLDPIRATATDYYMGRPLGNEEDGRSQVISTDLRDTVQAVLPSLMRVFFSPEHVVEYRARRGDQVEKAAQATEYINYVIIEDNEGFNTIYAALKDALVRKTGLVKWLWEYGERIEGEDYTGLSKENVAQLMADPEVQLDITAVVPATAPEQAETYNATVRRTVTEGRARIFACPPETVAWNRGARDFTHAAIVVHTEYRPMWELLQMGYPRDVLEEAGTAHTRPPDDVDRARRFDQDQGMARTADEQTGDNRLIRYDETYPRIKLNEKDGSCLYRICFVGDAHVMVGEPTKIRRRPFALFVPDPEPHTIVGLDYADYTMDIQRIKSMIWRGTLDSLSLALMPRVEAVDGMVNMKDLLNTEIGAVIRVRQPGMVREVTHRFVGADALPMMEYTDSVKELRTGQSRGSQGLDPDALQSATKTAVAMTYTASQQRLELLARTFAETGFRTLLKGLLELVCEHQDRPRTIRLRGEYVEIDPRTWDATMDVSVNVALGAGMIEERLASLSTIAEKQEQVLGQLGPNNPLVSLRQYRYTLARMTELAGHKNSADFWKEITPQQEQQMDQAAAQAPKQPQGDPALMAQVEVEKAKLQLTAAKNAADQQNAQAELELKAKDIELSDDRQRDKDAAEVTLSLQEQEMEHTHAMEKARLDAELALEKERIRLASELEKSRLDNETKLAVARIQADATVTAAREKPQPVAANG